MVGAVKNILVAESELCKDGLCDFNIKTASLRLYSTGTCSSQWEVQEKLKDRQLCFCDHDEFSSIKHVTFEKGRGTQTSRWQAEPIIQLCHYKDYVDEIIKKHTDMLNERKRHLRESLETLIHRLVDVDSSSRYLEARTC